MYKKSVVKSVKAPTKNVYYIAGYVDKTIAERIESHKRYTGSTTAEILRNALTAFFEREE